MITRKVIKQALTQVLNEPRVRRTFMQYSITFNVSTYGHDPPFPYGTLVRTVCNVVTAFKRPPDHSLTTPYTEVTKDTVGFVVGEIACLDLYDLCQRRIELKRADGETTLVMENPFAQSFYEIDFAFGKRWLHYDWVQKVNIEGT